MNDGENLDVDSLVRSLNQIAEKENDEIIAHVDKLYDKTVTLASPRLMKESNLDFTHQGALLRTPNGPAVSLTKSSPTYPVAPAITTLITLIDIIPYITNCKILNLNDLSLRELEASSSFSMSVFFSLNHPRVSCS